MPILRKILDTVVYSNLFIAFAVACFTLQTAIFFPEHGAIIEELSVLNFIATFMLYNLQRLFYASRENLDEKYNWYPRNRRLLFTGMALFLISFSDRLLDFFIQHPDYFFIYCLLTALSLLYFLPPVQLKKYGLLKPFIIAFVFVACAVLLPLYKTLSWELITYAAGQFCFIAGLCVLFDIKDLEHDRALGLKTLPIRVGIKKTKYLCILLLLLYTASAGVSSQQSVLLGYLGISVINTLLILLVKPLRTAYFYFYLLDGLIVAQYVTLQYLR